MTLEDFFLQDYEAMRKRVKELEEEVERLRPGKFGIRDLGHSQEMVMVSSTSEYTIRSSDLDIEGIEKLLELNNTELAESGRKNSYGSWSPFIKVERTTFPFTIEVTDLTSTTQYATNGYSSYETLAMVEPMEDNLGAWCPIEYEQDLIVAATKELRDSLEVALRKLREQEDEA